VKMWILLVDGVIPADGVHADIAGVIEAVVRRVQPNHAPILRQEIPKMPDGHQFKVDVQRTWITFQIFQREAVNL
jgi:hypothetical protein